MRALFAGLVLLAVTGAARADDAYNLPPVGAQLTFRLISTTKLADHTIIAGQIYTYTITSVSGADSEGTIRPVALIYGCSEGDERTDCTAAAKMTGAKREGDLLTIPVPDSVADALIKQSSYKGHYFLVEERTFPMPGPKDPHNPDETEFGDTPLFVLTNRLKCDYQPLATFFPLGKTPQLSLDCTNAFSRSQSRIPNMSDQSQEAALSVELSYVGADKLTLPSGDWDVQKVRIKYTPKSDTQQPGADGESDVAVKLGLTVKSHTSLVNKASNLSVETASEMIAYKPPAN
ncbi:MAG TPA: hypothetical protein VGR70_15600 [Stellaceae bacterium]|nr:hypothetical protein [Stellaceae bacterium]